MKKRLWHGIDKSTNPYGIGCWQIAGNHHHNNIPNGWGNVTEFEAIDLLSEAMENGIDFFDTAQGYNNGKSEKLLGEAIKNTGKEVVVSTKVQLSDHEISKKVIGDEFQKRVEESLNNLNLPMIDILLIHNPPDDLDWKTFDYDLLENLVEKKLIGTFGVSSKGLKGAKNAVENKVGTTLEWVFNLFERRPINHLFPTIEKNKMNFIARSPISRGLINPKYLKASPIFDKDDFRSTLPKDWIDWTIDLLKIYHNNGISESEIVKSAIQFCLQYDQVNSVILGVKSKKQLDDYLKVSNSIVTDYDFKLLQHIPEFYPKWG